MNISEGVVTLKFCQKIFAISLFFCKLIRPLKSLLKFAAEFHSSVRPIQPLNGRTAKANSGD